MSDYLREHGLDLDEAEGDAQRPTLTPGKRTLSMGGGSGSLAVSAPGKVSLSQSLPAGGAALDASVRAPAESSLGVSFGQVRVHQGEQAAQATDAVGARAFALGNSIYLGRGESPTDLPLMAHELAHVVQQRGVAHPGLQYLLRESTPTSQPGDALEAEADRAAAAVLAGRPAQVTGIAPAGVIHRRVEVTAVASRARPDADVQAMTIQQFIRYTDEQADWSTHYSAANEPQLRQLLMDLLADSTLSAGTQEMQVSAVLALSASDRAHLHRYCEAVHHAETVPTAKMDRIADTAKAVRIGQALPRLEAAVNGGGVLYHITLPDSVIQLIDTGRLEEFIAYCNQNHPQWMAGDGAEFESFFAMRPYFHVIGPMVPEIRNLHHFEWDALFRLAVDRAGGRAGQPLSLIIHSGLDWNGAFHQDSHLTAAITSQTNRVIMIEGRESLDSITNDLPGIAARYGGGHIDQVMLAGHGEATMMELAGRTEVHTTDDGRPEVGQVDDTVDLEHNEDATRRLFDRLIGLMDGPNRRIVLNACLTGSNDIEVTSTGGDPATQIRDQLRDHPGLAEYVRQRVTAAGTGAAGTTVVGASGSFPEGPDLADSSGRFDILWGADPALTSANQLDYVRTGLDPTGVLRAVLSNWEAPGASPPPAWLQAVADRLRSTLTTWKGAIIQAALGRIQGAPGNAAQISELAQGVGPVEEAYHADNSYVSNLVDVPDGQRGLLFAAVQGCAQWPGQRRIPPLGIYQLWAMTDASKYGALVGHLGSGSFTMSAIDGFLDWGHINGSLDLGQLLPSGAATSPSRGQLIIAFSAVLEGGGPAAAVSFLRTYARANGGRFPASSNAGDILDNSSEDAVLDAIGMGSGAAQSGGDTMTVEGNVDGNRPDGTNDRWVERIARNGTVVNCTTLRVRNGPGNGASEVGFLSAGDTVFVFGIRGPWYAIDFNGATGYVYQGFLMLT